MKKIALVCLALIFAGCAGTSHEPQPSSAQESSTDAKSTAPALNASGATTGPTIEAPPTFHKGYKLTFRSRTSDYEITYQGEQKRLLEVPHDTSKPFYLPLQRSSSELVRERQSRLYPFRN